MSENTQSTSRKRTNGKPKTALAIDRNASGELRESTQGARANPQILEDVRELWLALVPGGEICRRLAAKHGVSERNIYQYRARIVAEYRVHDEEERNEEIAQVMVRLDGIYTAAFFDGDYKAALAATEARIKLRGLNAPKKVEVKITSGVLAVPSSPGVTAEQWVLQHGGAPTK